MPVAAATRFRIARSAAVLPLLLPALLLTGTAPRDARAHPEATFYRGEIAKSVSWEGTIRLLGTVTIREGVTVTVEPGTQVLVQPGIGARIEVRGRLLVRGVSAKTVLFDSAGGCDRGPWAGILFLPGSTGILEHVAIRCADPPIDGELSRVTRTAVTVGAGR